MKFDPDIRSVATIRCTPGILLIIEDLMLETCSFDGKKAPPGTRTMDWGFASCCRSGVPDVIFDRGASRSEPLAWVLGQDPREVAAIIGRISHRFRGVQEKAGRTGTRGE
jgi:hydroxymethylpyrimidine/phosphomethylpyrimidine kinase